MVESMWFSKKKNHNGQDKTREKWFGHVLRKGKGSSKSENEC